MTTTRGLASPGMGEPTTVRATIVQAPTPDELLTLPDWLITVGEDGRITGIEPAEGRSADIEYPEGTVLTPGFVDTHIHAPQWPQRGKALDEPLEKWLHEYTFPLEARFEDLDFAREVYTDMVRTLMELGTTAAVYYGSIHVEATTLLAEICIEHGQRALIGRVAMDHPDTTPDYYRDRSARHGVEASRESIEQIRALGSDLVQPIVTPRFIPSCTDELLEGLAELAEETGTPIQTHCSESDWEHNHVLERTGTTDTQALDQRGLLKENTILAHATHITDHDMDTIIERGAGVAHCPLSNAYFSEAVFRAREAIERGMKVGLGTDISGGPDPDMSRQVQHALTAARYLEHGVDATKPPQHRGVPNSRITPAQATWMATTGGAQLAGIGSWVVQPGKRMGETRAVWMDWPLA